MIEKLRQRLAALLRILRRVRQLLQVLNAREGFRRAFVFERTDIPAAVDDEADQLGQRGLAARVAERRPLVFRRLICRYRFAFFRDRRGRLLRSSVFEWIEADVGRHLLDFFSEGLNRERCVDGLILRQGKRTLLPEGEVGPLIFRVRGLRVAVLLKHLGNIGSHIRRQLFRKARLEHRARVVDHAPKAFERRQRPRRQQPLLDRLPERVPGADASLDRNALQRVQRGPANAARPAC